MEICKWEKDYNAEILAIEKECFIDPWSIEMLDSCFDFNNFYGLVAKDNGKIVGYIGTASNEWDTEILNVAVTKEYRRRGIAKLLLGKIIEEMKLLKKENVFLEVRRSNLSAQSLYFKMGFVQLGIRAKYYQNTEDALILGLKL